MKSTADRYREAGMPPPKGEAYIPLTDDDRSRSRRLLAEIQERFAVLPERTHDPSDPANLPEIDPSAYGPDSVPLDTPDADTTEETS